MVPSILILVLAWSLGDLVSNQLQAGAFVYNTLQSASISTAILPACLFIVGAGLSFSTGTSWGTFGILIPMATSLFPEGSTMLVISIASILAGAVCGDHISPISESSLSCNHSNSICLSCRKCLFYRISCCWIYTKCIINIICCFCFIKHHYFCNSSLSKKEFIKTFEPQNILWYSVAGDKNEKE